MTTQIPITPSSPDGGNARITARLGAFRFTLGGGAGAGAPVLGGAGLDQMAAVFLDAPGPRFKAEAARQVLSVQNGQVSYSKSAPDIYMGDTLVKVSLRPCPEDPGLAVLDISARDPDHLTYAFIYRDRVARAEAEGFWTMFQLTGNYILTVAESGKLDLGALYVVKYYVEGGFGRAV